MRDNDTNIIGVSSYKKRTTVQSNRDPASSSSTGECFWGKDVWHIRASGTRTVCGVDSSEYMNMGEMKPDWHLCSRCAKKAGVVA